MWSNFEEITPLLNLTYNPPNGMVSLSPAFLLSSFIEEG
jgi:hypothetical protein